MSRNVLAVVGGLWAIFGVASLVAPSAILAMVGIDLTSAQSMTEIRAMYGGAQLGFGGFLLLAARRAELVRPGLLVLALVMAGFALGRVSGIAIDGAMDRTTLASLATEVALLALALFALSRAPAQLVEEPA